MSLIFVWFVNCIKRKNKLSEVEFATWYETHNDDCHLNFESSSGSMEAKAALTMRSRSDALRYSYRIFIGNSSTQSFKVLCDLNAGQGLTFPITK